MSSQKRFRILVVDDLPDNILLLQTLLEAEGYDVETAESGSLALAKVEANPPDLVLLDIMMPGMNGYEVTQQIRQNSALPFFPILLISAHERDDAVRGLDLGANDFIRKPINFDELLARVRAFLRSQQQNTLARTVLVIEDSPFDALHLERIFSQLNLTLLIQRVARAEDAIEYLGGEGAYGDRTRYPLPNFVILDLKLPGMSGLDFLQWLRQQPELQTLPVIGITGSGNRDLPQACELGIKFYLLKPVEVTVLTDVLQQLSLV
ncbi:response regulator [Leptolyngbya sp. PL-A3]|nr:response regulator [Leptolyngbya sp. FACHB-8]MBD2156929.1 response regulator [Leptolyngbya sp. FACHB-16]